MCVHFLLHVCMRSPPHVDIVKKGFLELVLQMVGSRPFNAGNKRATNEHLSRPCFFFVFISRIFGCADLL